VTQATACWHFRCQPVLPTADHSRLALPNPSHISPLAQPVAGCPMHIIAPIPPMAEKKGSHPPLDWRGYIWQRRSLMDVQSEVRHVLSIHKPPSPIDLQPGADLLPYDELASSLARINAGATWEQLLALEPPQEPPAHGTGPWAPFPPDLASQAPKPAPRQSAIIPYCNASLEYCVPAYCLHECTVRYTGIPATTTLKVLSTPLRVPHNLALANGRNRAKWQTM
jgi:hypothetical protein